MIKCLSDLSITRRVFECKMILIVYMSNKKLVNVPFSSIFMNLMSDLSLIKKFLLALFLFEHYIVKYSITWISIKLPLTYHVKYSFLKLLYPSLSVDINTITHIVILSEIIQSTNFV